MYTIKLNKKDGSVTLKKVQKNIVLRQTGRRGEPGKGVPTGGTTGQVLSKNSDDNYDTEWVSMAPGGVQSVVAGTNVTVDNTDPANPIVSADGSGDVESVNGQTGVVVLDAEDVGALPVSGVSDGDIYVDYIGGKSDANVTLDMNANVVGTLKRGNVDVVDVNRTINTKPLSSNITLNQDEVLDGTTYKQYSQTEKTKLSGIETGADVTDSANVDAAGATMNTDTSLAGNGYFLDEDDMSSNSATKVPSQQSVKAYVDATASGTGDVDGPASSTADNLASFNGTTGKIIKDSGKAAPTGTIVGTTDTQTLTNKTVTDSSFIIQDDVDNTKKAQFQVSSIGTGTTRTFTFPNVSGNVYVSGGTDVSVADGGTGRSTSTTAYGLIAAGTTATGAHQTLATGSSGQILKSNGASALPTFQTGAPSDVALGNVTNDAQLKIASNLSDLNNTSTARTNIGLGNVDNTSDSTKNSAVATLTNKSIDADTNTITNIEVADMKGTAVVTAAEGLASSDNDTSLPTTAAVIDGVDYVYTQSVPESGAIQMRQPNLSSWYADINDARAIPVDMVMIGDSISVLVDWPGQLYNQLTNRYNTRSGLTNSVIGQTGYLSAGGNYGKMNGTLQGTDAAHGCHIGPGYETAFGTNNGLYSFSAANNATSPDAAALDITSDISIITKAHLQSWIPGSGATKTLIGKWQASGQFAYRLQITTLGLLNLTWSTSGSNAVSVNSTIAVPFTNEEAYVGASLDVNNGASGYDVKFYTSLDGVNWTQLGTTVVGGSTTSISSGTSVIEVGSTLNGTANFAVNTKIERTQIYSGLYDFTTNTGGTLVFDANFEAQAFGTTSFTESSSNAATVTVNASAGTSAAINTLAGSGRELAIGNSVSSTNTCSGIYVVFKGGGGTLTVKDGGSGGTTKATIDTSLYSGNNNIVWVDMTTYASHNMYIECSVATTIIDGICTTAGNNTAGVLFWRVGREGASSNYYSGYPGHGPNLVTRIKALRSREPHVFIQTGYNDGTTTTYQNSINRLIDDVQTRTSGSILLMAPWQRGVGLEKSYVARTVAAAQGTGLTDAGRTIGDVSDYADIAALSADGIHPNTNGALALAWMNYAVLSGDPIGAMIDVLWANGRNYGDILGTSFSLGAYSIATIFNIPIVTSKNTAADPGAEHTTYGSSLANVFLGYNKYVEAWGDTLTAADVTVARHRATELSLNMGAAAITNRSSINGVAKVITTPVGNVGTGEDNLMSWTSPANALSGDGQGYRIEAVGTVANNANTKTLKVHFGATSLSFTLPISIAGTWVLRGNVVRTGAATQILNATVQCGTTAIAPASASPTETLSSTSVIKCTGEATADNDIVQTMMKVYYDPNGA